MFFLGLLVGRGTSPVSFDTSEFQESLARIVQSLEKQQEMVEKPELDFYEALKSPVKTAGSISEEASEILPVIPVGPDLVENLPLEEDKEILQPGTKKSRKAMSRKSKATASLENVSVEMAGPETLRSANIIPEKARPETLRSANISSEKARPETLRSANISPEKAGPETVRSSNIIPEKVRPATVSSANISPEKTRPETVKSASVSRETSRPETAIRDGEAVLESSRKVSAPPPVPEKSLELSSEDGAYTIQVAAYRELKDAIQQMERLNAKGYPSHRTMGRVGNDIWHRVRIGSFKDIATAKRNLKTLENNSIKGMIIKKE